ncbi:ATP-binding protein [Nostocoides sp. HKS02]|uniref:sensor histidine kinase n=1 Tax=Nostocoides sp. HKS02 TaxID=1813880 RepID=UPI0012B4C37A|nr:ATP-binding protein [Tetrasphaera sp. HKS02]QGN57416.1 HAMP domain-containing protein [Tetrasphaera sp. HKS02]
MSGWLARLSLRWRLMALGIAGVAGALVIAGLLLYAATSASLRQATEQEARSSATDVASLVNAGRLPQPVPVSGALVVQVLDSRNRVVGGSATADRLTSLVTAAQRAQLSSGAVLEIPGNRAGVSGSLLAVGVPAGPGAARVLVVAAVPTVDLETSRRVLRTLMLVFFPLFLLLIALIAYRVVGLALRPVDRLRQGAERIGDSADLTERLPVLAARDEISALATTLNEMLARLSAAHDKQRTFVADAAHELRSPLASLQTQLEVAQHVGEGGELPAELLPDVQRLAALVEDLLVLARSGTEAGPVRTEDLGLGSVVDDVLTRYAGARVPVRRSAAPGSRSGADPVVVASRDDVERALANLVDNAVRHATGSVTVSVDSGERTARVVVRDDGGGIPQADLERVFDRFARLDEGRARDSGGSGLGLAITRELLRRNGARVWLEDGSPGVRAVVAFDLA